MSALPSGAFGDRVRSRLRDEMVIWFTTVGADGTPQPNPVWFVWDGADSLLIYNRADANRVAHVAARPEVSLHFDGNGRGGDIVVLAGTARRDTNQPPPHENNDYLAKYRDAMIRVSGSSEQFADDYPVPIVIDIRRVRGH
jgi:PPOX class probable F420-dependent enzyme